MIVDYLLNAFFFAYLLKIILPQRFVLAGGFEGDPVFGYCGKSRKA